MTLAAWLIRLWDSSIVRGLVVLLVLVALFWVFYAWGSRTGDKRARSDEKAKASAAVAKVDAEYREREKVHEHVIEQIRLDYAATQARAQVVDSQVVRDLESGTRRVRIQVARCRTDPAATGSSTARVDGAETAELPGPVAAALWAIAVDGDQAIRQLTALQAWAMASVALCGGK